MSKYWRKTVEAEYRLWKNWQTDMSLAPKDRTFMGRLAKSNRSFAVKWTDAGFIDMRDPSRTVELCQWIEWADFAEIRNCVWRGV